MLFRSIRNHIYIAARKQQHSTMDQANVKCKVTQWQKEYHDDKFYFRPFTDSLDEDLPSESKEELGDLLGDVSMQPRKDMTRSLLSCRLLFVHQAKWQRRLMERYGNEISLLDATHKTTRYAMPLFFVAVKTNADYQVVASFVVQDETASSVEEALKVIKEWCPTWHPNAFMVDYSEIEINAISKVFPGICIRCSTLPHP